MNIGVNSNTKNNCTRLTYNCIDNNPTITREDNCTKPQYGSLFWDGLTGDEQIGELFYDEAKIIIASQAVYDHYQNVLKEVKDIKLITLPHLTTKTSEKFIFYIAKQSETAWITPLSH